MVYCTEPADFSHIILKLAVTRKVRRPTRLYVYACNREYCLQVQGVSLYTYCPLN